MAGEFKAGFNRQRERDYVPCVCEWDEPDGRHVMMVVRNSSSGRCMRSLVISNSRPGLIDRVHHVTEPGQLESAADVWRDLAKQARVTPPSFRDPTQHIAMR